MMETFAESLRNVNNCKIVSLVVSHCDSTLYTLNFKNKYKTLNIVQSCHGATQHCTVAARHDHYNNYPLSIINRTLNEKLYTNEKYKRNE